MDHSTPAANTFILQASDAERLCPVLQARFDFADLQHLQALLGTDAEDDPDLRWTYFLDAIELAAVTSAFGIGFDPAELQLDDLAVCLKRVWFLGFWRDSLVLLGERGQRGCGDRM